MKGRVRLIIGLIAVAAIAAIASTSTPNAPRRTIADGAAAPPMVTSRQQLASDEAHREAVAQTSIEDHGRFRLGIVELDDQGRFWNRAQYDQVVADLRRVYNASAGVQTIVFVHGWKHSASLCDSNLACFRELLADFAEQEGEGGRPVYGVYVGWRGLSIGAPALKELTFWSRKVTAHRVGSADAVELLATLEAIHRQERAESPGTRLTTIGHSFGGAAVYSALAGSLKERIAVHLATPAEQRRLFVGFGTLTLLVNPAFEATLYDGIDRMVALHAGAFDVRNPRVLVTVASEGDLATRYMFPMGRAIGTVLQRSRGREQTRQMLRTVGNYAAFATHRLDVEQSPARSDPRTGGACVCQAGIREVFAQTAALRAPSAPMSDDEFFGGTRLVRTADTPQARSPFVVVRADRRVIADHTDIWSRPFVEFMAALITRTDALLPR